MPIYSTINTDPLKETISHDIYKQAKTGFKLTVIPVFSNVKIISIRYLSFQIFFAWQNVKKLFLGKKNCLTK